MFHEIPDAMAVTRQNGIFRQVKCFHHNGRIFLKHGNGYVWVTKNKDTSHPTVRVDELVLPFEESYSFLGYLMFPSPTK